jgi:hypothetical protein
MKDGPESLWVWHSSGDWANAVKGGSGPCFGIGRKSNQFPLTEKERNSGAVYVRADLVEKMKDSYENLV